MIGAIISTSPAQKTIGRGPPFSPALFVFKMKFFINGSPLTLQKHLIQHREKPIRIHESNYAAPFDFLPGLIEKYDAGRAEQPEPCEQLFILGRVFCHVGLKQYDVMQLAPDGRIGKGEVFHFLAADAPVGIEIEHHIAASRLLQSGIQFFNAFYPLERQQDHGLVRTAPADSSKGLENVTAAAEGTDQVDGANQQSDHAHALAESSDPAGICRQRVESTQIDGVHDENDAGQGHAHRERDKWRDDP